ncbi:Transglutaminase-like enzyme, putative cysteine protease [Muriicola jejuensis]|uniref:Transglutaminase domain-containing protein n=1 Tax=Muriicola jejuensis TaxID=504488 RepID=A0A6P0UJT1_9FLAO|nr:transglutaminase domain-containing protein [Muriicola jejuensis]NER11323.1 transglutaminase domain-containing protein [Muriicola jejuensis]SMP21457.1 Transglutaminase-like enzyme, putative cysteine protease [Muriicola jejuensis]
MNYFKALMFLILTLSIGCKSDNKEKDSDLASMDVPLVVTADIEEGIKANIAQKVEEGGGYFHLQTEEEELRLQLVRVHTEYLSNLGPRRHFACVDLADVSGDVYDVDFFLEGDPGNMQVTETTLHKLNGKPFYTWKQRKDKTWYRLPLETASNDLLGIIEGEDRFQFRYEVTLPEITENAKIWIPIPQSDTWQTIGNVKINAPVVYQYAKESTYGNKVAFMALTPAESGEKIVLEYNVVRKEKNPYEDDSFVADYLNPSLLMPVGDRFQVLADSIIGVRGAEGEIMKARALYDYIIDNMKYIKAGTYGTGDANYACDALTGNCTEFHSLFISLARSAGIPARFAVGAGIPSDRNEGGIDGYHCWAEFYAEGKWWPVDISEANKYTALATYYFGRHPANRVEFTKGRDLVLDPGPSGGSINFMAYPVMEIGNTPAFPKTFFSFQRSADPDN